MYSSAYPYSRLCGGLSGVLGSGEKGHLFSEIYGELENILRELGSNTCIFLCVCVWGGVVEIVEN